MPFLWASERSRKSLGYAPIYGVVEWNPRAMAMSHGPLGDGPLQEHVPGQTSVNVIGCGSFGKLMMGALAPHCVVNGFDLDPATAPRGSHALRDWRSAAHADIIILAVPVQQLRSALEALAPHLLPGTLVVDVCSVKVRPVATLLELVPEHCDILGSHPLFGPQSARAGIAGSRIALVPVRGDSDRRVAAFLRSRLGLKVVWTTAENHDRDMAFVQGLTHLIARVVHSMDAPPTPLATRTYELMKEMCALVGNDSVALMEAIITENPFAADILDRFAGTAEQFRESMTKHGVMPIRLVEKQRAQA